MVSLTVHRPRIKPVVIVLCGIGMLFSVVALYQHVIYSGGIATGPSFCNISKHLNCEAVNASKWSSFLGLPIASYGLFFYSALLGLMLFAGSNRSVSSHKAYEVVLFLALLASVISLLLFGISEFLIGALCLMCLGLYFTNFALLGVAWWGVARGAFWGGVLGGVQNGLEFALQVAAGRAKAVLGLVALVALAAGNIALPHAVRVMASSGQQASGGATIEDAQPDWVSQWREASDLSPRVDRSGGFLSDYSKGDPSAPIQIVEFADIECQGCRAVYAQMDELLKRYEGLYHLTFKNFPLDQGCNPQITWEFHRFSCFAAYLTRCAGEQGKFWEALDLAFTDPVLSGEKEQQEIVEKTLVTNAVEMLSLDSAALQECVRSGRYRSKMESDVEDGVYAGVSSTPTLFINGRAAPSPLPEAISSIFDAILAEKGVVKKSTASETQVGE